MYRNQFSPVPYRAIPYNEVQGVDNEGRFLPFLAGIAITAPFWAGGFGYKRRCCYPYPTPYPYPYPVPYPYPYPYPYTYNTYQGVVGSPYSYYYGRPYVY
ncbi:hypothetical protein KHQ81_09940 [Mycoplasmatota bacterium]|nr:hypothetical protein KHQ81_09940 [Mycoplasmatota bacterium]